MSGIFPELIKTMKLEGGNKESRRILEWNLFKFNKTDTEMSSIYIYFNYQQIPNGCKMAIYRPPLPPPAPPLPPRQYSYYLRCLLDKIFTKNLLENKDSLTAKIISPGSMRPSASTAPLQKKQDI